MEGTGIFFMQANTTPENAPQVLKLLHTELETLLNDGITEEELRRAKDKWISSIVIEAESTYSRMRSLLYDWTREKNLVSIDEKIQRIEQVTIEDIMRVLHRFPLREKQVITTLGPLNEQELLANT